MDAALAALLGALIGALGSVGGMVIQQRHQNRRDLLKIAADIAREDWNTRLKLLSPGARIPPVSAFVHYHHRVLTALAEGTFSEHFILKLTQDQESVLAAYDKANGAIRQSSGRKA